MMIIMIELQNHYTHMKNLFVGGLKNIGLTFTEPQGAYYVMVDISEFGYKDDYEFCVDLAEKVGVGGCSGFQLLQRRREPVHPIPFCKEGRDIECGVGKTDRYSEDIEEIIKKDNVSSEKLMLDKTLSFAVLKFFSC